MKYADIIRIIKEEFKYMENTQQTQEQLSDLLQVRRDKLTDLQNENRDPFKIMKFDRSHTSNQIKENYTEEEREIKKRGSEETEKIIAKISPLDGKIVSIAGRIMSKRGMGKVGFVHVSDIDGQIQLLLKKIFSVKRNIIVLKSLI